MTDNAVQLFSLAKPQCSHWVQKIERGGEEWEEGRRRGKVVISAAPSFLHSLKARVHAEWFTKDRVEILISYIFVHTLINIGKHNNIPIFVIVPFPYKPHRV